MKKKVLGDEGKIEGADLIVQYASKVPTTGESITETPLEKIREKVNVRTEYKSVEELAESIRLKGLLQPIVVTKSDDGFFEIVFGHRRFKAFLLLSQKHPGEYAKIRAIVKEKDSFDADEVKEIQLIENIQREGLSPLELKDALEYLRGRGHTAKEIGERLGKGESYVRQLFSSLVTVRENPELEAVLKSDVNVTLADIQEIRPLPPKEQIALIREKAEGKIKNVKDLRSRVAEVKENLFSEYREKREEKLKSPSSIFQERSGKFILRFSFDPGKDAARKADLLAALRDAVAKLEALP